MKKRIFIISLVLVATITNAQSIFDAIRANDPDKVKTLIEYDKAVLKLKGGYGDTPLHIAALVDNDESNEYPDRCPIVSHDGKYLFYLRFIDDRYIPYWVDAKIIEELKPKELK